MNLFQSDDDGLQIRKIFEDIREYNIMSIIKHSIETTTYKQLILSTNEYSSVNSMAYLCKQILESGWLGNEPCFIYQKNIMANTKSKHSQHFIIDSQCKKIKHEDYINFDLQILLSFLNILFFHDVKSKCSQSNETNVLLITAGKILKYDATRSLISKDGVNIIICDDLNDNAKNINRLSILKDILGQINFSIKVQYIENNNQIKVLSNSISKLISQDYLSELIDSKIPIEKLTIYSIHYILYTNPEDIFQKTNLLITEMMESSNSTICFFNKLISMNYKIKSNIKNYYILQFIIKHAFEPLFFDLCIESDKLKIISINISLNRTVLFKTLNIAEFENILFNLYEIMYNKKLAFILLAEYSYAFVNTKIVFKIFNGYRKMSFSYADISNNLHEFTGSEIEKIKTYSICLIKAGRLFRKKENIAFFSWTEKTDKYHYTYNDTSLVFCSGNNFDDSIVVISPPIIDGKINKHVLNTKNIHRAIVYCSSLSEKNYLGIEIRIKGDEVTIIYISNFMFI
ncbi:hypothetical protein TCON_2593 [Astathelohania contejeani]|uniref:Uncharacterized protein n=1 Tax=Astathelohania contejeani TaxID=164912 RepID=A0ABQ7HVL0_9MICR|nr:hypothetical protein TCON_2593 [Thelohania contejeani]